MNRKSSNRELEPVNQVRTSKLSMFNLFGVCFINSKKIFKCFFTIDQVSDIYNTRFERSS
jgi:hypothetical protein